jgi:hypothetical protein
MLFFLQTMSHSRLFKSASKSQVFYLKVFALRNVSAISRQSIPSLQRCLQMLRWAGGSKRINVTLQWMEIINSWQKVFLAEGDYALCRFLRGIIWLMRRSRMLRQHLCRPYSRNTNPAGCFTHSRLEVGSVYIA